MKKLYIIALVLVLALSLCACRMGTRTENTEPETTVPTTNAPTSMPTVPSVEPNVPETTEGRGSTDDKQDESNETVGDGDLGERMRRRVMN